MKKKCEVEGCENKYYGKGYCVKHYTRMRNHGIVTKTVIKKKVCNVNGCGKVRHSKEYCSVHYARYQRTGNLFTKIRTRTCAVVGCKNQHSGLGYCDFHYRKLKTYGHPLCNEPVVDKEKELSRNSARRKARKYFKNINLFCVINGCKNKNIELHHENYEFPLEIIPLCKGHHSQRHAAIRRETFYNNLKEREVALSLVN